GHGLGLLPGGWAIPVTLAVGVLVGVLNAVMIIRFGLNGFIVTLGMLITLRGLLTGISKGQTFFQLPSSLTYLGQNSLAGVPLSVWLCVGLFLAFGGRWASRAGAGRSTPSAATSMPPGRRASARTE
ncbi:MAG TPA: hypothetical protein VI300_16510, partial [Solirubrobacter sp.]